MVLGCEDEVDEEDGAEGEDDAIAEDLNGEREGKVRLVLEVWITVCM